MNMLDKNRPSLLVVDDNEKNLYATKRVLEILDIDIDVVQSGNEALKAIVNQDYFLILMDVQMPDMDGFETVSLLRGNESYRHIPVIFLTANMKQQDALIAGYNEGAVDYLFKPIEPVILLSKVKVFLELKLARLELEQLASSDVLTGLSNRNMFHSFEERTLNLARRNKTQFAVLFLDLDHFKTINDTLGHDAGDYVLCSAAKAIKSSLRDSDIVARMGGDEFAILLTDISQPQDAGAVANDVLKALDTPIMVNNNEISCGASIGIACYPSCGQSCETLNKAADIALYKAKEQRNTFSFFSNEMQQQMLALLSLKQRLKGAIDKQELEVHYQVKVDAKTKDIMGMEALLRWHPLGLGTISPAKFIPLAEESGQIIALGRWVLEAVSTQIIQWNSDNDTNFEMSVAINVSPKQLGKADFVQMIKSVVQQCGIKPEMLELELTETALMEDPETAIDTLKAIHALGVKIAIDDFGTGYSSLSYLQRLPIDTVKIDLSFVRVIGSNAESDIIIKAIINLAHTLGMKVVAEGVETQMQAEFLTEQGCDYLQGYLYAKPLPAIELNQLLLLNKE
ncbi:MAG: EAL domain-containing protein [Algicola sp.]|nr:EAL domain-containing protein [Algicola sp.]